jgi:hypothetical protein
VVGDEEADNLARAVPPSEQPGGDVRRDLVLVHGDDHSSMATRGQPDLGPITAEGVAVGGAFESDTATGMMSAAQRVAGVLTSRRS